MLEIKIGGSSLMAQNLRSSSLTHDGSSSLRSVPAWDRPSFAHQRTASFIKPLANPSRPSKPLLIHLTLHPRMYFSVEQFICLLEEQFTYLHHEALGELWQL